MVPRVSGRLSETPAPSPAHPVGPNSWLPKHARSYGFEHIPAPRFRIDMAHIAQHWISRQLPSLGLFILLLNLSLLLTPGVVNGADDTNSNVPFGPGEKMVFSIGYGVVDAGEAIVEIIGLTEYQGKTCYQIQSKANSNRFFSSVYKVRDKIISYMDVETLYSRYFYKRLREGDYKKSVEISFDHEQEIARYANGNNYPTSFGVQDVLSAGYYVRTLDLAEDSVFDFPAHSSRKTYDLKVFVRGKETITVEAGTFECFVVEPIMQGEGLFKHEGKLTIYLSDDKYRVPVLVKTKVPVGSITVELKEFHPGRPLLPSDKK